MSHLVMTPAPGERLVRFVGDCLRFRLVRAEGRPWPEGGQAFLRTTLGRAAVQRAEIIAAVRRSGAAPVAGAAWRDIPLVRDADGWTLELPLAEVGWFQAKAYATDARGWQHWPEGPDFGVSVQPACCRTANTIYCAFARQFGPGRADAGPADPGGEAALRALDAQGYTVIPPSGKLRDLVRELPHIFDTLGCRVLHLLPVNPTPTTYARFGRFGSPYACEDLTAIDPALIEFDRRTTGVDQFRELAYAVHRRGGRLFLDIVINHTGWGSTLQERHPDWFLREPDGTFVSPGAWGTTWEDLIELEHGHPELRERLATAFLDWCARGVDGFRCDAGYKVPLAVWQYITARVRQEFPHTVFLLEGLGGAWEDTERLLSEGNLQWAYSELFQNYSGREVAHYLDHALAQSGRAGLLVHYSETHDNDRLARRGRAWSLLRNRLCALTSVSGGFGFTCGVEWLATERINVHSARGLAWGRADHLVAELARLNRLLAEHPCFFDGAVLTRLSAPDAPVYALRRTSAAGTDRVLVLVNLDPDRAQALTLPADEFKPFESGGVDLLGGSRPVCERHTAPQCVLRLAPGAAAVLAPSAEPRGLAGEAYRRQRAREALALEVLSQCLPVEALGGVDWPQLAAWIERDLEGFLGAAAALTRPSASGLAVHAALEAAGASFRRVIAWRLADQTREVPVPPDHWLLVEDACAFRATVRGPGERLPRHAVSVPVGALHVACFPPQSRGGPATLELERYADTQPRLTASLRWLAPVAELYGLTEGVPREALVLLTNGRGGMARVAVDLGRIRSKYDCLLAANLHPEVPVDRHVFAKRLRAWVNADGFLSPLNAENLRAFAAGPPARWHFLAHAGDGRTVAIEFELEMLPLENTVVARFCRVGVPPGEGRELAESCGVSLSVRVDLEDRSFHAETRRTPGTEHHFQSHTRPLPEGRGFAFEPAPERALHVRCDAGIYHPQSEWCEGIPHPVEASRHQTDRGDAFSPGWFEIPLAKGAEVHLVLSAEPADRAGAAPAPGTAAEAGPRRRLRLQGERARSWGDLFGAHLEHALEAFVVRRGTGRTVIAGYPWFLDWGRDTLIAARGLLAAGRLEEVRQILITFARLERQGTLPNSLHGEDASNRDTADAPLWFGLVCGELCAGLARRAPRRAPLSSAGLELLSVTQIDPGGRTLAEVLRAIASGYLRGAPNGIRVDPESGLVWSPAHFTWMDTNYPAGTPREGYAVEIQALWIGLLRLVAQLESGAPHASWLALAQRAQHSLDTLFWLPDRGYLADVLRAPPGQPGRLATPDDALRSNQLIPVSLGLVGGERARRIVAAARQHLVVPGALRSLAPLPVTLPLPIHAADGRLLNDPHRPYCGRYVGDEDTQRKPAYHNGTAWVWTFPTFCEALARAWDFAPAAVAAARAYLGSLETLFEAGCFGQLPEILDGDAPHAQRGCDAQAWSVSEALRVWCLLREQDE